MPRNRHVFGYARVLIFRCCCRGLPRVRIHRAELSAWRRLCGENPRELTGRSREWISIGKFSRIISEDYTVQEFITRPKRAENPRVRRCRRKSAAGVFGILKGAVDSCIIIDSIFRQLADIDLSRPWLLHPGFIQGWIRAERARRPFCLRLSALSNSRYWRKRARFNCESDACCDVVGRVN